MFARYPGRERESTRSRGFQSQDNQDSRGHATHNQAQVRDVSGRVPAQLTAVSVLSARFKRHRPQIAIQDWKQPAGTEEAVLRERREDQQHTVSVLSHARCLVSCADSQRSSDRPSWIPDGNIQSAVTRNQRAHKSPQLLPLEASRHHPPPRSPCLYRYSHSLRRGYGLFRVDQCETRGTTFLWLDLPSFCTATSLRLYTLF